MGSAQSGGTRDPRARPRKSPVFRHTHALLHLREDTNWRGDKVKKKRQKPPSCFLIKQVSLNIPPCSFSLLFQQVPPLNGLQRTARAASSPPGTRPENKAALQARFQGRRREPARPEPVPQPGTTPRTERPLNTGSPGRLRCRAGHFHPLP